MKRVGISAVLMALVAGTAMSADAVALKSPDKVKDALRLLAYVQADMASKLPNKAYARLPHENEEFQEAAPALLDAVAGEPAALQAEVKSRLSVATRKASEVAETSKSGDEAKITAAVTAVQKALEPLYGLFPAELRPVPGQLGGRPGRTSGPPPGLR
jgi:hypothetical protein